MFSTVSCFLLFGIIPLTIGNSNYYNTRGTGLVQNLSNLKAKYGLNFAHSEGMGSLPEHFKKSHPDFKYSDHNLKNENIKQPRQADYNNMQMYNLLVLKKTKSLARTRDKYYNEADGGSKESLRICKKKPKQYNCKPSTQFTQKDTKLTEKDSCEPSSESSEEDENADPCDFQKKNKKKRYYRAGDNKEHDTDERDETAILLNDLEKMVLGNGIFKVYMGCVGKDCGGRGNRNDYSKDNTKGSREYGGCTGDGCGRSGGDGTDIRRYIQDLRKYS